MRSLNWLHIALIHLAIINMVTFLLYGIDKWKAKRDKWRVSEEALIWMADNLILLTYVGLTKIQGLY